MSTCRQATSCAWVTVLRMTTRYLTRATAAAVALSIATAAPAVATTVFSIRGTDILSPGDDPTALVPSLFAGAAEHAIDYHANVVGMDRNTAQAVANLAAAEAGVDGPVVVAGFSQGAIAVALDKARVMALPEAERPAADQLSYVVLGDPTGPGGILHWLPGRVPVIGAAPVHVPDTPYDTIVINREYDGWADFPDRPLNLVADLNAVVGIIYVHGRYDEADLDPAHVPAGNVTTVVNSAGGKTTTYLVPTEHLPLLQPLRDLGVHEAIVKAIEAPLKGMVDAGYARNDAKAETTKTPTKTDDDQAAKPETTKTPTKTDDDDQAAKPAKHDAGKPVVRDSIKATPGKTSTTPDHAAAHDADEHAAPSPTSDADGPASPTGGAGKADSDSGQESGAEAA
ncbi:DNA binding protein [Mycobacterium phage SirPhilip]|uniref:Esterase n=1 Tax=Mycobacterium phage SirPhilip TaxID=2015824 RepID=A0A222ZKN7_9CAUD|nr:DNA binding protein [Mycobacterium phage SirPhilip]ASR85296.1 esterase [Mycobacterium phage SirPhilip]